MTGRRAALVAALGAAAGAAFGALEGLGPAGAAAGAVVGGSLGLTTVRPRAAWLLAAAAGLVAAPLGVSWGIVVLLAVHAFCAGRLEPRIPAVLGLVALLTAMEVGVALADAQPVPGFVVAVAAWAAGLALREREVVASQLAERARELEEERDAHAALAVRYERARIASDLHDIVAHAVSVMVIQAGAGQRVAGDPEATAETFAAIAGAAHEAERDMGRLVAMLADDPGPQPAPDAAIVEQLVARAGASGLDVRLRFEVDQAEVSPPVADAIVHVVREGLTNVLRHAPGAAATVRVLADPGAVIVEVENAAVDHEGALTGAGTGTGLRGLRERVAACDGTLRAEPSADGGWRLAARLPRR